MKLHTRWFVRTAMVTSFTGIASPAAADTTITTFDDFSSNALYGAWTSATIESGPTSYAITATGYGSNWKYNPVDASGNTTVELTVTLSGPPAADGFLGPVVTLEDADGTSNNYAWYGQTLGSHVLTKSLDAPTWVGAAGTVAGLDLAALTHLHVQLDPGGYGTSGPYTVEWENLSLVGAAVVPIQITSQTFDPATGELTLTWASSPDANYTVLQTPDLTVDFTSLVTDIASQGDTTTTIVTMPDEPAGFVVIEKQ